ncbi:hypothetical protein [Fodinibius sediminis]|uniref:BFD-like [2Fe-2S] binding domain-containing protein n=1 Tax=Fodinibius sediminis TaxID=1214077 RepID=A0A521DT53_9BACT|nr:hypothetical protein [Fodinibius sediminis]SMO74887.1 hypothetical protein SAMN06265218_111123 [Fodinibius sediminis]
MASARKVKKCVCHNRMFDEIKSYADEKELSSVEELREQNYCSNRCGLCIPYVKTVLKTGQTTFEPGKPY